MHSNIGSEHTKKVATMSVRACLSVCVCVCAARTLTISLAHDVCCLALAAVRGNYRARLLIAFSYVYIKLYRVDATERDGVNGREREKTCE